jgi:hypothetical protein
VQIDLSPLSIVRKLSLQEADRLRTFFPGPLLRLAAAIAQPGQKNKPEKRAQFSPTQKCTSTNQLSHAFHHKLSTKTPPPATHFTQKPL